jgi:hypothetical protein
VRGIASAVKADANLYLPDRVTPNPNFGRYYVEGDPRVFGFRSDSEESRAMLSYELDLTSRPNWMKWLGRHRAAAMYQRSQVMSQQQGVGAAGDSSGHVVRHRAQQLGRPMFNTFSVRAYLSDPTNGSTGSTYSVNLPFDPMRTTTYRCRTAARTSPATRIRTAAPARATWSRT